MKRSLLAAAVTFPALVALAAFRYEAGGVLEACVRQYYDARMYGWLTLENTCADAISVTYQGKVKPWTGTVDLGPGRHTSIGLSPREVEDKGGLVVAVCHQGFVPVESSGNMWRHPGAPYRCRKTAW